MRKTHNQGRKHKESVKLYYMNWLEQEAQNMIDVGGEKRIYITLVTLYAVEG